MSRRTRWIALVVVAGIVVILAGRGLLRPRPIEVEATPVEWGPVEDVVTNSEAGTIESRARARVGAERAGRIAVIRFEEGARARSGDVLVELDASTARTRLAATHRDAQALDAAHEVAHARQRLAQQSWERVDRLARERLVSPEQRDQAREEFEAAGAELKAAEARLAGGNAAVLLAEDEIAHLRVRAPFDGVVARHLVEIGESVVPGQPVVELLSTERLFASAPIDERDAGRIREGLPARVTLDAYPGVVWPAHVSRVAPMVEELKQQNRTLRVEAELDSTAGRPQVRAGMTADIEIVLSRLERVLRVPTPAVTEGRRVLVVAGGRARNREFLPGVRNWEWTEVRGGLARGDRVVTSLDRAGVGDGAAVRIAPRAPGASP